MDLGLREEREVELRPTATEGCLRGEKRPCVGSVGLRLPAF